MFDSMLHLVPLHMGGFKSCGRKERGFEEQGVIEEIYAQLECSRRPRLTKCARAISARRLLAFCIACCPFCRGHRISTVAIYWWVSLELPLLEVPKREIADAVDGQNSPRTSWDG